MDNRGHGSFMKQMGFILLTTMLVMTIMSLLVISWMQSVIMYQKSLAVLEEHQQRLYDMQDIALKLNTTATQCRIDSFDFNLLRYALLHHRGCRYQVGSRAYEYVLADWGEFPCLRIKKGKQSLASHHWLISIFETTHQQNILQIRVATPTISTKICESSTLRFISQGMVSWRY